MYKFWHHHSSFTPWIISIWSQIFYFQVRFTHSSYNSTHCQILLLDPSKTEFLLIATKQQRLKFSQLTTLSLGNDIIPVSSSARYLSVVQVSSQQGADILTRSLRAHLVSWGSFSHPIGRSRWPSHSIGKDCDTRQAWIFCCRSCGLEQSIHYSERLYINFHCFQEATQNWTFQVDVISCNALLRRLFLKGAL